MIVTILFIGGTIEHAKCSNEAEADSLISELKSSGWVTLPSGEEVQTSNILIINKP